MAAYNGTQCAIIAANGEPDVTNVGGRVRCFHETFTYASQASGSTITVAKLPAGAQILYMLLNTDTSTSTATLEFGDGTTAAAYSDAAAQTTANQPTLLGLKVAGAGVGTALSSDGEIVITTGTAALPSSGTLIVDTYYTVD